MKISIRKTIAALVFASAAITPHTAYSQRVAATTTTITSDGTVSEFGPQSLVITSASGTQPVHYISNDTTNYVDEAGNPVAVTTVSTGQPVTVYYTKVGDTLVASKIVVRKVTTSAAGSVQTTQTTTSSGTLKDFGPNSITVRTETSPDPAIYGYSKTTTYTDENGNPVSIETVKSGAPVTVYYTKIGNQLQATRVVVRKATVVPSAEVEIKTKTTTTKTEK